MTTAAHKTSIPFNRSGLQTMIDSVQEPPWITEQRLEAWSQFEQMRWPNQRDEEWMRTDIRLFKLDSFSLSKDSLAPSPASRLKVGVDVAGHTVAINGVSVASELDFELRERGVIFGDTQQVLLEHGELLKPYFNRAVDPRFDRFAALHAAFWSSGTILYVPRGVVIDKPLHSLSILADGGTDFGHTLVILDDGAQATLMAESQSVEPNTTGLHCGAVELFVGPSAHLKYVNLQDWSQGVWHFGHQKALVSRDASLQWTSGALGSRLAKINQHVLLVGEGASSQVNGVMFTENRQHLSYHTLQHHRAPHCTSDFLYKAALQDQSRTVWRGMIKVDRDAQKTDGYQRNDNLLLSAQARADSIPGLEIEADDVRCTHGSTSGRVDEELIFYAQARGFTRLEAIRMVVTGFFQQVFDRVTIESVREALALAISRRVRDYV